MGLAGGCTRGGGGGGGGGDSVVHYGVLVLSCWLLSTHYSLNFDFSCVKQRPPLPASLSDHHGDSGEIQSTWRLGKLLSLPA